MIRYSQVLSFELSGKHRNSDTVEPLVTHTHRWTAQAMGYEWVWLCRGVLTIDLRNFFFSLHHGARMLEYNLSNLVSCGLQPHNKSLTTKFNTNIFVGHKGHGSIMRNSSYGCVFDAKRQIRLVKGLNSYSSGALSH